MITKFDLMPDPDREPNQDPDVLRALEAFARKALGHQSSVDASVSIEAKVEETNVLPFKPL